MKKMYVYISIGANITIKSVKLNFLFLQQYSKADMLIFKKLRYYLALQGPGWVWGAGLVP